MEKIEIWEMGSGRRTAPSLLSTIDGTKTEEELEDILVRSPDMLERGLQLVGRQTPMTGGGYLDLLAVDGDGRLVVFELKRGTLSRDAVAQVVDYASDLDAVDLEDLAKLIVNHSGSGDIATIDDFIDWYDRQYDGKSIESLNDQGFAFETKYASNAPHIGPINEEFKSSLGSIEEWEEREEQLTALTKRVCEAYDAARKRASAGE